MAESCVLIIEPDTFGKALKLYFRGSTYDPVAALSLLEASDALGTRKPDAVLVAIEEDSNEARQMMSELRDGTLTSGCPIVVMSKVANEHDLFADGVKQLGAKAFIKKPFIRRAIIKLLDDVIAGVEIESAPKVDTESSSGDLGAVFSEMDDAVDSFFVDDDAPAATPAESSAPAEEELAVSFEDDDPPAVAEPADEVAFELDDGLLEEQPDAPLQGEAPLAHDPAPGADEAPFAMAPGVAATPAAVDDPFGQADADAAAGVDADDAQIEPATVQMSASAFAAMMPADPQSGTPSAAVADGDDDGVEPEVVAEPSDAEVDSTAPEAFELSNDDSAEVASPPTFAGSVGSAAVAADASLSTPGETVSGDYVTRLRQRVTELEEELRVKSEDYKVAAREKVRVEQTVGRKEADLLERIQTLEQHNHSLEEDVKKRKQLVAQMTASVQQLNDEMEEKQRKHSTEIADRQTQLSSVQNELDKLNENLTARSHELEDKAEELARQQRLLADHEAEREQLQSSLRELAATRDNLESELATERRRGATASERFEAGLRGLTEELERDAAVTRATLEQSLAQANSMVEKGRAAAAKTLEDGKQALAGAGEAATETATPSPGDSTSADPV